MTKKTLLFLLLIFAAGSLFGNGFILVKDHKPQAVIQLSAGQKKSAGKLVEFFNEELKRCLKTSLPVAAKPPKGKNVIQIELEKRPLQKEDAFSITFPGKNVMKITATKTSLAFAFNHILQKELGIRYLFPAPRKGFYGKDINHYPAQKSFSIPRKAFSDKAVVNLNRSSDWRIINFARNWNGKYILNGVHMVSIDVFPVYKYAPNQSWPREILPTLNGKKFVPPKPKEKLSSNKYLAVKGYDTHWQLCWSHPATTKIAIENILESLKKNPNKTHINMDVNDNGGYCQCAACRKAVNGKLTVNRLPDYSLIYWKWVNDVAREVSKKYPNVIFYGIAYREVITPPPFKLHKNVLPRLCIELPVIIDKKYAKEKWDLIGKWSKVASQLDLYDYMHGIDFFLIPRIYFRSHSRILRKMILEYKLRAAYFESRGVVPFQGPQQELMVRLLWDPKMDVEKFLRDWCEKCVGKKAAPYLMEYYKEWEKYWTGENIKKTPWYESAKNVYMQLGELATHTYALKKGDMAKFESLMKKVVANAGTPEEKRRAQVLMSLFLYSKDASIAFFSEIFPPDGNIKNIEMAKEVLRALPESMKALDRLEKSPWKVFRRGDIKALRGGVYSSIGKLVPFLKDKEVRKQVEKLSKDPAIPFVLRAQMKIWLGAKATNLIPNGSWEKASPLPPPLWGSNQGRRSTKFASEGKYSYETKNGFYQFRPKVQVGKSYLFLCDVFIPKGSGEGRFSIRLGMAAKHPISWQGNMNNVLKGGSWETFSILQSVGDKRAESLNIQLYFQKFENHERVYFDNVRLYDLEELK